MSSRNAAPRVAAPKAVTATLAALLSPARAEASRRNGAKSKGPRTAEGKARSAQNALKHGLRAERFVVVGDEDPQEFAAHEAALLAELAPAGALQTLLAGRIVRAAWRLARADQIESELFAREMYELLGKAADLGLALIRDCNGARAFGTLLRYRGAAQAELARSLRLLKALQAEAAQDAAPRRARAQLAALPSKPETRATAGDARCAPVPDAAAALAEAVAAGGAACGHAPGRRTPAPTGAPIEPDIRGKAGESQATAAGRAVSRAIPLERTADARTAPGS